MNKLSDKQKENLSAFIDNEQVPEELANYGVDAALLHRYQLMGDAIRGSVSDAALIDVSEQVKLALENEPVHSGVMHKTSQQPADSQSGFNFGVWLRPLGGLAVAASVAVVMVMVVNQPDTDGVTHGIGVNGVDGQIANINTQPVVSLPVSNRDRNNANNLKMINGSESDLEEVKKSKPEMIIQHRVSQ